MEYKLTGDDYHMCDNLKKAVEASRLIKQVDEEIKGQNRFNLKWKKNSKQSEIEFESRTGDFTHAFVANGGWKMVLSYLRRYEVIGLIIKNEQFKTPVDAWLDLDEIKNDMMSKSKFGELNFVENYAKEIISQ